MVSICNGSRFLIATNFIKNMRHFVVEKCCISWPTHKSIFVGGRLILHDIRVQILFLITVHLVAICLHGCQ